MLLQKKQATLSTAGLRLFQESVYEDESIRFWGNLPFLILHLGCLLAFWTGVTPAALAIMILTLVPRMFGLTAGYHRYFSHRSFKTSRGFQWVLALLGASSIQKDPLWWAAHHRHHHRFADTDFDAHSPSRRGFFWSHVGWVLCKKNADLKPNALVPDFMAYPELVYLNRHQKTVPLIYLGLIIVLGFYLEKAFPDLRTSALTTVVWGFFISTILLHHATFFVNSASHIWGSRRFKTPDTSRNNWWVALLTMGEGWHNNHHRFPSSERQGFYWWELDMTHLGLKLLSFLGLVWDLKSPPAEVYEEAERSLSRVA